MANVVTTAETNLVTAAKIRRNTKNPDDGRYHHVRVHHNGNAPARQCS